MSLKTIGEVAREFGVSTRMLRYYDETGLLPSIRTDASPYRLYDEEAVMQLQRILLLKSLRIPLKQIAEMLRNPGRETAAAIFRERTQQIEREIAALQSVSHALKKLAQTAPYPANTPVPVTPGNEIASERLCFMNMSDSFPALAETMGPVRILYLPPCTVAAFRFVGESPEERAEQLLTEFAEKSRLSEKSRICAYSALITRPRAMTVPTAMNSMQRSRKRWKSPPRGRKNSSPAGCTPRTASKWGISRSGAFSAAGRKQTACMNPIPPANRTGWADAWKSI